MIKDMTNGEQFEATTLLMFIQWMNGRGYSLPKTRTQKNRILELYLRHQRKERMKYCSELRPYGK